MSQTFDKLKELLAKQNTLSQEEIDKVVAESGALTDDERVWLESERHRLERAQDETVTMDQYLAALKVLDTAAEDSDEFKKANELVERYEKGQ
ncbi:MAG: hypothetical protein OHK0046_19810 [Anaerolineae bacterium]